MRAPVCTPIFTLVGVLGLLWAGSARATEVEVHVAGVTSARGAVRALVCNRDHWLTQEGGCYSASAPAHPGTVVVRVPAVPPGVYGIVGHHDANANGDVDQGVLGIPTEGIGFSRDPSLLFGSPGFDSAALEVAGAQTVVNLRLKFEPSGR